MRTLVDLSVCSAPFRRAVPTVAALDPASLFATGVQGVWIDPSDTATLFQDSAGTVPVAADGQPVALALDKSRGLVRGPELMPNGFGTGNWSSFATGVSVNGGLVHFNAVPAGNNGLLLSAVNGSPYHANSSFEVTVTISDHVSGGIRLWTGSGYSPVFGTNGVHRFLAVFPADQALRCYAQASGGVTTLKAALSVRELPGAHASQPVLAARPIYANSGGLRRLVFDGIDDRLRLRHLAMTSGASLTGAVGLRKLGDALVARVLHLAGTGPTLALNAPGVAGQPQVSMTVNNGSDVTLTESAIAAPASMVALMRANIAAPHAATLRINGRAAQESLASSGTGATTWGTGRDVHLGERSDGGARIAGHVHGLVLFNAALTPEEQDGLRVYMAQKSGATV